MVKRFFKRRKIKRFIQNRNILKCKILEAGILWLSNYQIERMSLFVGRGWWKNHIRASSDLPTGKMLIMDKKR